MVVYLPFQKMFLSTILPCNSFLLIILSPFTLKKLISILAKQEEKLCRSWCFEEKSLCFYASPLNPNFECWVSKDILIKAIITMHSLSGDFLVQNSENFVILLYFLVCWLPVGIKAMWSWKVVAHPSCPFPSQNKIK